MLEDYQVERLTAFIGASRDTSDAGYQLDQSKTAIGSGGTLGKGPDGATQTINDFLPEHQTDFIFAVTAEMFGFAGRRAADPASTASSSGGGCARWRARPAQMDQLVAGGDRGHARLRGLR